MDDSDRDDTPRDDADSRNAERQGPRDANASRADWATPEGGGSREDARDRVHDGAASADEPPPGASFGGTGTGEPGGERIDRHRAEDR